MMQVPESVVVISLGGSIVVPDAIDVAYIQKLRELLLFYTDKRFVLVVGGGKIARQYQQAYYAMVDSEDPNINEASNTTGDLIGIAATRLNAELLRAVFLPHSSAVITNPEHELSNERILIAGGWKPGFSTDYIAVTLAKRFQVSTVINLSNIDFVYSEDPRTNVNAVSYTSLTWKDFQEKCIPTSWKPGMNAPFDPVASRYAQKHGIGVIIAKGSRLDNLKHIIDGNTFIGTTIY